MIGAMYGKFAYIASITVGIGNFQPACHVFGDLSLVMRFDSTSGRFKAWLS